MNEWLSRFPVAAALFDSTERKLRSHRRESSSKYFTHAPITSSPEEVQSVVSEYLIALAARRFRPCTILALCSVGLAGCSGGDASPAYLSTTTLNAKSSLGNGSQKYRVLFSFGSDVHGLDGAVPVAPLLNVNGTLYGTTQYGGAYHGGGTVFRISTTGAHERVLYSFRGNGSYVGGPVAGLTNLNGTLYGTTAGDGLYDGGTVFSISTIGTNYRVLHNFGNGFDGAQPRAALIAVNGRLYGTTYQGGAACGSGGCGTVFRISTSGNERVMYSFRGPPDGESPLAGLINVNGTLYGTTQVGGSGRGTVFSVSSGGAEHVLHSFSGPDGEAPAAGLMSASGTLYGTTAGGGRFGEGTVFSMTGAIENVLHSFGGSGSDGIVPVANLSYVNGVLYGTTSKGGVAGYGTVFRVTVAGKERVLHSFDAGYENDGLNPEAGLIDVKGTLYGTTQIGGISLPSCYETGTCDYGTVFALTP
jgi:uncharacterized repeat protein (TIGR03803 family)